MVPERRVAEAPTTQVAHFSDNISPACKEVLDTEKIMTWTEAQAQQEALPMRHLFGILAKLPGCMRGATSAERAADTVRWLQTRSTNWEEGNKGSVPCGSSNPQETPSVLIGVLLLWLTFWFGFTFGAWIMGREKPAEYWFPGPVSSALRVLRAVEILSWDEVGYARLLEDWTEVPALQSARTACLTSWE